MPEKQSHPAGNQVAGGTLSTNGSGARPHHSTNFAAGDRAIWKNADHDEPVVITGLAGELQGVRYFTIAGSSTGIPEHELQPDQAPLTEAYLTKLLEEGAWAYIWTPNTGRFYVDKKTGERKEAKEAIWFPVGIVPQVPAGWAGRNVYYSVFPSTVQRAHWQRALSSTIAAMSCFFGEYDVKDWGSKEAILEHLRSLPIYPSVVIDSGGGYHCIWFLDRPVILTDANRAYMRRLLYAWVDFVGSDPASKDLARVLRLPGTKNCKPAYGPNFPEVHFVECHLDRTVPLERIEQLAGHLASQQPERGEYDGTSSTLDDMAAAIDALQRLGKHHADDYGSWIKVGQALKAGLGDAGLPLWREWSQASPKYKPGDCEAKWETFSPHDVSLGSLIWLADQDQPREKKQRERRPAVARPAAAAETQPDQPAEDIEATKQATKAAEWGLVHEGAHDEGNAQCVHLRYKGQFCHNDSFGWMQHTGSHWTTEGAEAACERAITETLLARIDAALHSGEADKHGELIKRCIPSSSRVQGAKAQLKSLVYVSLKEFDADPDLLNCPNGVVNLRTGTISPHTPEQRFTHCTAVPYEPKADRTVWLGWLAQAAGAEQIDYLQIAQGYSITGHTREEVLFYLVGPPRSGKGIYAETMLSMLGTPLADVISFSTLTAARDADTQNFNLAPLHGARLIMASESNQYERFNEAKVKSLTGGDKIQAAFKFHTPFSYRPKYKIWLSSNQPVNADPDDDAVWGRIRVIEFPHSHLGHEDKTLKQSMLSPEVLTGVLAWTIEGAQKWYELGSAGLPELPSSLFLKQQHRDQLDAVGMWLEECCSQADPTSFTAGHELFSSYKLWCESNGQTPKQMKGLSQALKHKGLQDDRQWEYTGVSRKLKRGFKGVALI